MSGNSLRRSRLLFLLFAGAVPAQPAPEYMPRGRNYIVNYGAIRNDPFLVDFAARQFVMVDEQSSTVGRQLQAVTPGLPVLHYHCLVSAYPWASRYYEVLNPDERAFMHGADPSGLRVSRTGNRIKVSWSNDRRYPQVLGYRIRLADDSTSLGRPYPDTVIRARSFTIDTLLTGNPFLHIATVRDSGQEAWFSSAFRTNAAVRPGPHHRLDSLGSAGYGSYRDTLRDTLYVRIRVDSLVSPDSVIAQLDTNHNRNPGQGFERFRLTFSAPFWTGFWTWERHGWKAGTGFRILVYRPGAVDTLPGGGYLYTTNVNHRLRSNPYGNELMNPCDSTWQAYSLNSIAGYLAGPDYYGVFTDNTTHKIQTWMFETSTPFAYDTLTWRGGMCRFLARIDTLAAPAPVFFNGLGMPGSELLLPYSDGGMYEGWTFSNWSQYGSEASWKSAQNQVLTTCNRYGKTFLALPQAVVNDTACRLYVRGSYLLTASDSSWYANASGYSTYAHWPEMNLDLGRPLTTARESIGELRRPGNYYVRRFARGVVIVNPGPTEAIIGDTWPDFRVVISPGTSLDGSGIYSVPFTGDRIARQSSLILLHEALTPPAIGSIVFDPTRPTDRQPNRIMARVTGNAPLHVEAALTRIMGPLHTLMNDQGTDGDAIAGDSVFTGTFTLPTGVAAREDTLWVLGYDTSGLVQVARGTVLPGPADSLNRLANWSYEFDGNRDAAPDFWNRYSHGYHYDTLGRHARSGTRSVHVVAPTLRDTGGCHQRIYLNQTVPETLLLTGWSQAVNVTGSRDNGYALYADCRYTDNTPLYGQCAQFNPGTHDWEFAYKRIMPAKPISYIDLYALFRGHTGEVWFDHLSLKKAAVPEVPILLSPAPDSALNTPVPGFDWTDVDFAIRYELQLDDDPAFITPRLDTLLAESRLPAGSALPDTTWHWRVRAGDDINRWSGWSATWRFTIDTRAPAAPILLSPDSAAARVALTPTLVWHQSSNSQSACRALQWTCRLQLAADSTFSVTSIDTLLPDTSITLTDSLAGSTVYYWRVRAIDPAGNAGPYSTRFEFTTAHGLPSGWTALSPVPPGPRNRPVGDGAALAHLDRPDSSGLVFALKGNNTCEFFAYHAETDQWETRDSIPAVGRSGRKKTVKKGACLTAAAGAVFAAKGNNSLEWWYYTPTAAQAQAPSPSSESKEACAWRLRLSSSGAWRQMADIPLGSRTLREGVGAAALVVGDTTFVFVLKGSGTREFYRCNSWTNAWHTRADAPLGISGRPFKNGSCLTIDPDRRAVYALKGGTNEFFAYSPDSDRWTTRAQLPLFGRIGKKRRIGTGAALAYDAGSIYAFKGGNSNEFYVYRVASDSWTEIPELPSGPRRVKGGGALTRGAQDLLYALRGNKTSEFWRYAAIADDNPPQSSPFNLHSSIFTPERFDLRISSNPLSLATTIHYTLLRSGNMRLSLYDLSGKLVTTLSEGHRTAGSFALSVSRSAFASGVYVLHLDAAGQRLTSKFIVP